MAKLKASLFSFSAKGSLAKILSFRQRKSQTITEKIPIPEDAKSLAQLSWRHMYQKAVALWLALSPQEKQDWESLARRHHMTGYAWFLSQCLKPNPGIYLPLQGGTMQGDIDMAANRILNLPPPSAIEEPSRKAELDAHTALTTGVHGVGSKHVAAIESAGAEAPLKLHTALIDSTFFHEDWKTLDKWTESYVGSGNRHLWDIWNLRERTGDTINSEARVYTGMLPNFNLHVLNQSMFARLQIDSSGYTNFEWFFGAWQYAVAKPPSLTAKHVGWKVINGNIYATNADGTTEKATDTGIDFGSNWASHNLLTVCTQTNAEIKYYVDEVLKATHSENIPDHTNSYIYASVKNTVAANRAMMLCTINAKL